MILESCACFAHPS